MKLAIAATALVASTAAAAPPRVSDARIRQMLATRIDVQHQGTGAIIGIVARTGRRVIAYGQLGKDDRRPITADTVFDIGSVTKVFTALVLADMAARGEVALDEPVTKSLPQVRIATRGTTPITLVDLATHTSGLPLRPDNLVSNDPENKYAGYDTAHLFRFVAGVTLASGGTYEYSNVGYGLLAHALAARAGQSYGDLLAARVLGPLGMRDTQLVRGEDQARRAAVGYRIDLTPAARWDMAALEGAGALSSTANDLMTLLEAAIGARKTDLAPAIRAMLETRRPGGMAPSQQIALAWNLYTVHGHDIAWKNGSVGGFRAFIALDLAAGVGVVALVNAQTAIGLDDIGLHLLEPSLPVDLHVPKRHKRVAVAAAVLDHYVGRYRFSETDILTVARDGDRLYGSEPGQDRFELVPEGPRDFFLTEIDAQVQFVVDRKGAVRTAIWHQGGQDQRGERVP